MASDDLNAPLGLAKIKRSWPHLPFTGPQALAGVMAGCGFVVVCWAVVATDPLGGEPTAVVSAKSPDGAQAKQEGAGDGQQHTRYDGPNAGAIADAAAKAMIPPAGSKTVTIIDGTSGQRQDIVIPGNSGGPGSDPATSKSTIDPKMLETTRHGAVPQIAADGTRPSAAYAKPRQLPANRKDAPRIAVIINGIGISASGTADAFSKLPAPVTFALAPYSADLDKLAENCARGEKSRVAAPGADGAV